MSCSPPSAWITLPAPRNSNALKNAWVVTWNMAALYAPMPSATNMYPSWLTVEYASTFLMSFWNKPTLAAINAVAVPTHRMMSFVNGANSNNTELRTIKKIPAVTIVAAWISALTGVGPAMASGSQVNNGSCALLPVAPMKRNSVAAIISGSFMPPVARSMMLAYSSVPKRWNSSTMPSTMPTSPMRFITKALRAA